MATRSLPFPVPTSSLSLAPSYMLDCAIAAGRTASNNPEHIVSVIRQTLTVIKRVAIVVGIAIAFSLGVLGAIYLSLRSSETRVPDIVGKDRLTAENTISSAGLNFRVRATRATSDAKPDTVLIQLPHAGEIVKVGQTVAVDISRMSANGESPAPTSTNTSSAPKTENTNTNAGANANDNKAKRKPSNVNNANGNANANRNLNRNRNTNRATPNVNGNRATSAGNENANSRANVNRSPPNVNNRPPPAPTP